MHVKGTAFMARQAMVIARVGERRWNTFLDSIRERTPEFPSQVIAVTNLPVEVFLRVNDALVDEFFEGDPLAHWEFGEASAEWAMREGPYRGFFASGEVEAFLSTAPTLWQAYYSEGRFVAQLQRKQRVVTARITDLPVKHIHFEYNVMGYLRRALELVGATVHSTTVGSGFSKGDADVHYTFELAAPAAGHR